MTASDNRIFLYLKFGAAWFFFAVISWPLIKAGWSRPLANAVAGSVVVLAAYWIPPRPKISFIKYLIIFEYIVLGYSLIFWLVPPILKQYMIIPFAYGIPSFLFLVSILFVLRAFTSNRRISAVTWIGFSLILAVIISVFATLLQR
jgi:hypothetical protein